MEQRARKMKMEREMTISEMDDSFKRPGTIPFKWEIQPGVPKRTHASPAAAAPQKLCPPPCMQHTAQGTSPTLLSPSAATASTIPAFSSLGCFSSPSFRHRGSDRKKVSTIFSLLRRRSMSDHFTPLPHTTPEEDEFEVSCSEDYYCSSTRVSCKLDTDSVAGSED